MSNQKKGITILTVDTDGKKLELTAKPLGYKVLQEAQMVYNVELTSLIKRSVLEDAQLLSRQQLEQYLDNLGLWTEDDNRQFLHLQLELRSLELQLKEGGIKVSEAKKIALEMKTKRAVLLVLYNRRAQFDGITMESIADNKKFKFLIVNCIVVAENGTPFFASVDDYEARQNEQAAVDAATVLAGQLYGYDEDTEANLIENKWLKEFNFADKQGRLVNKDNKLVDMDGHLIDKDGRFVDKQGKFVDDRGRPVDESGNFVVKTKPFIDDKTGKPLVSKKRKRKVV